MTDIKLKFDTIDQIITIAVENNSNAVAFADNINKFTQPADYISPAVQSTKKAIDDFVSKATAGNKILGFDWDLTDLSQNNFNQMHRDIEKFDLADYSAAGEGVETVWIELHEALHQAETLLSRATHVRDRTTTALSRIQLKWHGESYPWPQQPQFTSRSQLKPGDVIADYPHVGKTPINCMKNNDTSSLATVCKLPDAYAPSVHVILQSQLGDAEDSRTKDKLCAWYNQHAEVLHFTKEEMLLYYGEFKIGSISLEQINLLKKIPVTSCQIMV